jgi:formylglycine-generating enzyme required for sulfatase activity
MAENSPHNHIFLSYSRTDKEAAKALRTRLEQAGFSVFRDEESIRIGDNWLKSLQDAVQGCAAFVLLVGRDGVQQQRWVGAEVEVALSRKLSPHDDRERLPIFPVLLPEASADGLPAFLGQVGPLRLIVTDGEDGVASVELVHEMLVRPSDRKDEQGHAIGYWPTLFNYVFDHRDRDYQRQQLQVDAQRWQERKRLGRWFGLAGWRDLRVFRHQRPRPESVEGRYLRRSRWVVWGQSLLLAGLLGVLAESAWWADQHKLPFSYALIKPLWTLGYAPLLPAMSEVIPPGKFTMGCVDGRDNVGGLGKCEDDYGATPAHEVTLTQPFQLGKYEVTFMEYDYYVWNQQRKGKAVGYPSDAGFGRFSKPIINVSWEEATAYIGWLNEQTNKNYRLPTEAEWEYAARGGKDDTAYPWGKTLGKGNANCRDTSCKDAYPNTAPVGSFPPTAFGLYDMSGNVYEWCEDWYGEYADFSVSDPKGAVNSTDRVVRGGSWNEDAPYVSSAYRRYTKPSRRGHIFGFRLVLPSEEGLR